MHDNNTAPTSSTPQRPGKAPASERPAERLNERLKTTPRTTPRSSQLDQILAAGLARPIRERAGWTLDEVATVVGVRRSAVAAWENGTSTPPPGVAERIYGRLLRVLAGQVMPSAR